MSCSKLWLSGQVATKSIQLILEPTKKKKLQNAEEKISKIISITNKFTFQLKVQSETKDSWNMSFILILSTEEPLIVTETIKKKKKYFSKKSLHIPYSKPSM